MNEEPKDSIFEDPDPKAPKKGCEQVSGTVWKPIWKSGTGICRIYPGCVYRSKRKMGGTVERRGWDGPGIDENHGA